MINNKTFLVLLMTLVFPTAAFSFFVPAEGGLAGLGKGNVQAIEAEFRAMEQAALLFRSENPTEAGGLQEGVNHIADLSKYPDAPSHYSDTQRYGLLVDSHGWWLGIAVPKAESMREYVVQASGSKGWVGSPDTSTPPGSDFRLEDEVVWKLFK
jgi:hypothetical protein